MGQAEGSGVLLSTLRAVGRASESILLTTKPDWQAHLLLRPDGTEAHSGILVWPTATHSLRFLARPSACRVRVQRCTHSEKLRLLWSAL